MLDILEYMLHIDVAVVGMSELVVFGTQVQGLTDGLSCFATLKIGCSHVVV